jgi:lipid-A-disaccharide synthase
MRYYIIAGERSGDLHGGNLVKALKRLDSQAVFRGFGGDDMKAQGVDLFVHYREMAFMGFVALITNVFKIFRYIARCKEDIRSFKPNVIITIDYGGFNRRIAKFGRVNNIPVFYYIPPKVWAWYQRRAWELKKNVTRMFVILPFEKEFFKRYGMDVDYVGNPVLDAIKGFKPDPGFRDLINKIGGKKIIALLPGSRVMELKRIVPIMAEVAMANPEYQFVVAAMKSLSQDLYEPLKQAGVYFVFDATYDLLSVADAAIVTSGTATLETGLFKVPQVVVYRTGGMEFALVEQLVKIPFISLVNLIAGKEVVKELIQKKAIPAGISKEIKDLLEVTSKRDLMILEYEAIYKLLDTGSASENAARLMVKYLSA